MVLGLVEAEEAVERPMVRWPLPTDRPRDLNSVCELVQNTLAKSARLSQEQASSTLRVWLWNQRNHRHGIARVTGLLSFLVEYVAGNPAEHLRPFRGVHLWSAICMGLFLGGVLRLRRALSQRRVPKWARQLEMLMAPDLRCAIQDWNDPLLFSLMECFLGPPAGSHCAVVYAMGSHGGLYVGKAALRQGALPGLLGRVAEHLRAVLHPRHGPGRRPRYRLLRRSVGSLFFIPVLLLRSERSSYHYEAMAIRRYAPTCNVADSLESEAVSRRRGTGLLHAMRKTRQTMRRRPPSWRRAPRATTSAPAWVSTTPEDHGIAPVAVGQDPLRAFPGALSEAAPYGVLYRLQQAEHLYQTGEEGPLWIFEAKRLGLLLAFFAARWHDLPVFRHWTRLEVGAHLYRAAAMADQFLRSFHRQRTAMHHIDLHLRRFKLPCPRRPLLRLPADFKDERYRRWVGAAIQHMGRSMRYAPARSVFSQPPRAIYQKERCWKDAVSASRFCATFTSTALPSVPEVAPSPPWRLRRLAGPWRLPKWPKPRRALGEARAAVQEWTSRARLPPEVVRRGLRHLQQWIRHRWIRPPEPPSEWQAMESEMQQVLDDSDECVIISDDKDCDKVWACDGQDLFRYLHQQALMDPDWRLRLDISPRDAAVWMWGRAVAALPEWLRTPRFLPPVSASTRPPYVFPTVKGKCFSPSGQRICQKPFHSCFRRVVNCSDAPGSRGFQIIGRAARDLLYRSGLSCEVFNLNRAATELRDLRLSLPVDIAPACCACGQEMGFLSIVVADADQAFEQCGASTISQAWSEVAREIARTLGVDATLVKQSRSPQTCPWTGSNPPGWFKISVLDVQRALIAFSWISLVSLGGVMYEMRGLPIGGVLSGVALSVLMCWFEHRARHDQARLGAAGFHPIPGHCAARGSAAICGRHYWHEHALPVSRISYPSESSLYARRPTHTLYLGGSGAPCGLRPGRPLPQEPEQAVVVRGCPNPSEIKHHQVARPPTAEVRDAGVVVFGEVCSGPVSVADYWSNHGLGARVSV